MTAAAAAALILGGLTNVVSAADQSPIAGLSMGATLEELESFAAGHCAESELIEARPVRYPLAAASESTLLCRGYTGTPVGFSAAAFVVADGKLVQVEAEGVDPQTVAQALGEPDGVYLGMNNYRDGTLWFDTDDRRLVWLTGDARHPNLFAWENPLLSAEVMSHNDATVIPEWLNFSASLEELLPEFEQRCPQMIVNENERVWLPNKPKQQVQIDCFGYSFAGFSRKFEAVFGDGRLQVIWILTGKPEEPRMRAKLQRDWGQPTMVNDSWEIFGDGRISLYKDKPEFLVLSDEMIPLYRDMLAGD